MRNLLNFLSLRQPIHSTGISAKMSWKRVVFLSLAAAVVLLAVFQVGESAAVRKSDAEAAKNKDSLKKIFMKESEASNFFKKRGKRSTKSQDEINAENRQRLSADERRREYYEEQRNEFENYVEEEQDEQEERTREQVEQWRQWHYDGLSPSYLYQRQTI